MLSMIFSGSFFSISSCAFRGTTRHFWGFRAQA